MEERDIYRVLNLRIYLVHRVGADEDQFGPGPLQGTGAIGEDGGAFVPIPGRLTGLNFLEVYAVQYDLGRVEAAQLLLHQPVELLIIGDSALPAHTADQSDGLHRFTPFVPFLLVYGKIRASSIERNGAAGIFSVLDVDFWRMGGIIAT